MGRLIGYARVSMAAQNIDLQITDLRKAGCVEIFTDDGISGAKDNRPGFNACLAALKEGDTLVVWKLDRLARSIRHLIDTVGRLKETGIAFKSISEAWIDTTNPQGRFIFHIFAALAEFERELIIERTRAGLAAAFERGSKAGPKFKLTAENIAEGRQMLADKMPLALIGKHFGISESTVRRRIMDASN